jgi:hypothetical protein
MMAPLIVIVRKRNKFIGTKKEQGYCLHPAQSITASAYAAAFTCAITGMSIVLPFNRHVLLPSTILLFYCRQNHVSPVV